MKLTTLEIKGFKSFGEKTTVHFNNNITGIVGPNGCGKSNIVDSIRWVLGEQKTSSLRLEKMDNLIFNGTKKKKASSLAEVSLTFENTKNLVATEYKNITITRRLFRNGESEYRLNDVPCRLKDITNLFLDTGVGSDSYAIIELGMVDDILSDRESSRRKLFEQASGISKYKKRKKETLNKLKGTEADLERVQDLLYEIEGNLKSLEKQAKRTQRYYDLKEQYKELSIELAKFKLQHHKEILTDLRSKQEKESDKKLGIEKEIKTLEAKLQDEKLSSLDKEKALSALQKELNELVSGVSSKENKRNILSEQIKFLGEKKDNALSQNINNKDLFERIKIEIENLKSSEGEKQQAVDKAKATVDSLREELDQKQKQYDELKSVLTEKQLAFANKEKELFEREKEIAVNNATITSLQSELAQTKEEDKLSNQDLDGLNTQFESVKKLKLEAEKRLNELKEKEQKNLEHEEKLESEIEEIEKQLQKVNRKLDSKQNEYDLTKSLVENLEGFPESIKFLKKNQSWAKEAPLLTDLIYCSEEYRVAIENFLKPYLNYYVAKNVKEAVAAVNLLSDASKGRANFFILDELAKRKPAQPVLLANALPATEIVEIDKKYKVLANFLLENVYIVEDTNALDEKVLTNELSNKKNKLIILTKSGKLMRSNFSISGGAVGLFEGKKIGRAKNLEKLATDIAALNHEAEQLNKKLSNVEQKLSELKEKSVKTLINEHQMEFNQANDQYITLKTRIENSEQFIENNANKVENILNRIDHLKVSIESVSSGLDGLRKEKLSLQSKLESSDQGVVSASESLSKLNHAFNEANIEYHKRQNDLNALLQNMQFKQSELNRIETELRSNEESIKNADFQIKESTSALKSIEDELLSGIQNRDSFKSDLEKAEQTYYDSKGTINETDEALRSAQRNKEVADTVIRELEQKFNDLKLELSGLKERLMIEFKVNIDDLLKEEINDKLDKEELETKVEKLKHRIDHFGEINPLAIEAFNEIKERYDFIVAQRKDLNDAKESLMKTIQEIEETATKHFLDAFYQVRKNFKEVFRTLFSEDDKCDLVLMDESDPLESKIEIIAKPKGKRPTVIDQLSGGEKTLTATALLFSLYLLKPAPFCIFDEVDAPLDDTNIAKFNNIIRKFSENSQFIIVTHNKQTMTTVDVIYGVTMPEQGISKVVPVDFSHLN